MNCTHCGKRLSRKTARQIDGAVMCSTCMFKTPAARIAARRGETQSGSTGTARAGNAAQTIDNAPNPTNPRDAQ